MTLGEVRAIAKIASDAGLRIDEMDYGWSIGAWNERLKKGLTLSEVFRAERDGYTGGRLITEECLRDWIKENPASTATHSSPEGEKIA